MFWTCSQAAGFPIRENRVKGFDRRALLDDKRDRHAAARAVGLDQHLPSAIAAWRILRQQPREERQAFGLERRL